MFLTKNGLPAQTQPPHATPKPGNHTAHTARPCHERTVALLFATFYFSPQITVRFPANLINLPNKDYWLLPENRAETQVKILRSMYRYGVAFFLFFFVIGLLVLKANLSDPVAIDLSLFYTAMGLFLGYTGWWIIRFYREFRRNANPPVF